MYNVYLHYVDRQFVKWNLVELGQNIVENIVESKMEVIPKTCECAYCIIHHGGMFWSIWYLPNTGSNKQLITWSMKFTDDSTKGVIKLPSMLSGEAPKE